MAEPTRLLTPDRIPTETYKPLPPLALVALILAGAFAGLVGILGGVAYLSSAPLFLNAWVLIFPLVAWVLAMVARRQIRQSEGALGGEAVCSWAWWLSVIAGGIFAAHYFGTYFAVKLQAQSFAEQWLAKIRDGKTVEAFLDTVPPARRKWDKSADAEAILQRYGTAQRGGPPPLPAFRVSDLVQFLQEGGPGTEFKCLGVRNWEYSGGGYRVVFSYAVSAPTGEFEFQIPVQSHQGKEFEGRQWTAENRDIKVVSGGMTALGQTVETWRAKSRDFVVAWLKKLHEGKLDEAFLDTVEPEKRFEARRLYAAQSACFQTLASAALVMDAPWSPPLALLTRSEMAADPELARSMYLEGYEDFARGKILHHEHLIARTNLRQDIVQKITSRWSRPWLYQIHVEDERGRPRPVGADPQVIRIDEPIDFVVFPRRDPNAAALYICKATVLLESNKGPVNAERQPDWRVVEIDLQQGRRPSDEGAATPPPTNASSPKPEGAGSSQAPPSGP